MRRCFLLLFGLLTALGAIAGSPARAISPLPCSIGTIYFDFDSWAVGEQTRKDLASQFECLRKYRPMPAWQRIVIVGNADLYETVDHIALSTRRAETIRDEFIAFGLPAEIMEVTTRGDAESREWYGWTHRAPDNRNGSYRSVSFNLYR